MNIEKHWKAYRKQIGVVMLALVFLGSGAAQTIADETIKAEESESLVVPTASLIPPDLLESERYQLSSQTTVWQGVALFEMNTEFGTHTLAGREALLTRVDELRAIEQLRSMKGTDVYSKALKSSTMAPVETMKNIASEPVATIANVGRGLGGFLADVGYSIVSDNPDQENVAKTAAGHGVAKRQFAFELGVSPYSDFRPLQDELSEVSWTAVGGSLTAAVGFEAIGGTAGTVLSTSGTVESMRGLVRDNSPRKLQKINEEKLLAMNIDQELAEALLDNYNYDPETMTRLVGAIYGLGGVENRAALVKLAALQDQPYNATLVREAAELMQQYHANVQPVKGIVMGLTWPFLRRKDDSVIGLFPGDTIAVDPTFEARNRRVVEDLEKKGLKLEEVWITGTVDPALRPQLARLGWGSVLGDAGQLVQPKDN